MYSKKELLSIQSNSPENVDETAQTNSQFGNQQLITKQEVEGTEFMIVTINEDEHFITWGKHRVSDITKNKEELVHMINDRSWRLIGILATSIATEMAEWKLSQLSKNTVDGTNEL